MIDKKFEMLSNKLIEKDINLLLLAVSLNKYKIFRESMQKIAIKNDTDRLKPKTKLSVIEELNKRINLIDQSIEKLDCIMQEFEKEFLVINKTKGE